MTTGGLQNAECETCGLCCNYADIDFVADKIASLTGTRVLVIDADIFLEDDFGRKVVLPVWFANMLAAALCGPAIG